MSVMKENIDKKEYGREMQETIDNAKENIRYKYASTMHLNLLRYRPCRFSRSQLCATSLEIAVSVRPPFFRKLAPTFQISEMEKDGKRSGRGEYKSSTTSLLFLSTVC